MRSLFWINFCMAVFFSGMLLIMIVVILLYGLNLDMEQTSQGEFIGTLIFTALLAGFVSLLGLTAYGLHRAKDWWWLPEAGATSMAAAGVIYLSQIV